MSVFASFPAWRVSLLSVLAGSLVACSGAPPGESEATEGEDLSLAPARFDVVTISDTKDPACPSNFRDSSGKPRCIAEAEWIALDYAKPHFVVMGSDEHRAEIEAAGNHLALYFNTLNGEWPAVGGSAAADDAWAWANEHFSGKPPTWFIVNEVSRGAWEGQGSDPEGTRYRAYVVDFVTRLAHHYGRKVVLCTPYVDPRPASDGAKAAAQAASWRAIAKEAFIASEVQMTGAAVAADPGVAERLIQRTITAYADVGIDTTERLMIVDSFANTKAGAEFGRAGASAAEWEHAITVRAHAYHALRSRLRGYLSYAWAGNEMESSSTTRIGFEEHYAAQTLP